MRNILKTIAAVAILVPAMALAQTTIVGSKHDLAVGTAMATKYTNATETQTCKFCHVPHHANNAAGAAALWNRNVATSNAGWGAAVATAAGTTLPSGTGTSRLATPSQQCMNCHDGSVGLGSVYNNGTAAFLFGSAATTMTGSALVGTALAGNHPVSVPYPAATTSNYNGITTGALPADYKTAVGAIKLFGTGTNQGIECTSCHEPHKGVTANFFLRVTTVNSALCTACHNK